MINTKNIRQNFLEILSEIKNISNSKTRNKIIKELFNLRDFIKAEYDYDSKLPTLTHNFVDDILTDIDTLDLAITSYLLSVGYELPKDMEKDLKNITNLSANFKNKYSYKSNPVLKGRITNNRYIWHTNPNACQKCQDLNNTVYSNKSDLPDKPHPNCKCNVKEIEKIELLKNIFDKGNKAISSIENEKKPENTAPISQENSGNNNNYEKNTIEDVYQYIQKNNKAPHLHITQNIYWDEVIKTHTLQYGKPSIEILQNLQFTASKIQEFRNKYYSGTHIQINSGWRPKAYNDTIGEWKIENGKKVFVRKSNPNSEHIYGNAIDFLIIGHSTNSVSKVFAEYWKGRWYYEYGFIHADSTKSRGTRANW